MESGTPAFDEFDPTWITSQVEVLNDVYHEYDYSLGVHEVLLSGSIGSGKSLLCAHLIVRHCLENNNARFLLGRKSLPDLRETIYTTIVEHLEGTFIEGVDYWKYDIPCRIRFRNGSRIISRTWSDRKYKKTRSLNISGAFIEELTEGDEQDQAAYHEFKMRIGRIPHIKNCLMISATNPGSPSGWAYEYFMLSERPTRHVYYSLTKDNNFLPDWYLSQLQADLDPKQALRMLEGQWIEISSEAVYHAYSTENNFVKAKHIVNEEYPIHLAWDFNIGLGKPLSMVCFQVIGGIFHFFDEVIIEGASTLQSCQAVADKKLLDHETHYFIHMDATGKARSTKSLKSDYDIIEKFMGGYRTRESFSLSHEMAVPRSNPPIRTRQNIVNSVCRNSLGQIRLKVYSDCKILDKGFRLTQFKKGSNFLENDNNEYQHCTTAAGYGIMWVHTENKSSKNTTRSERIR